MSTTYKFKTGDAYVPISGSIPLDLTGGSAFFVAKNRSDGSVMRYTASIHDPVNGGVAYLLTEADLSNVARYVYEWKGHAADGQILTEPNEGYFELYVTQDLDPLDGTYSYNSLTVTHVNTADSASYALTASYALNGGSGGGGSATLETGSYYPITASWSDRSSYSVGSDFALLAGEALSYSQSVTLVTSMSYAETASYALNAGSSGTTLETGSLYPITSSWSEKTISSSFSNTASYALNAGSTGTTLTTGSTYPITSSWSSNSSYAVGSDYAILAGEAINTNTSSFSHTASYALNAGGGGTTLTTGSTYPITSSQAVYSQTSDFAVHAQFFYGQKGGLISAASFGGSPPSASVVFDVPYVNTNYVIILESESARLWSYHDKSITGFVIDSNSSSSFTSPVYWLTLKF